MDPVDQILESPKEESLSDGSDHQDDTKVEPEISPATNLPEFKRRLTKKEIAI